jgi:hypothetical protein
MQDINTSQYNYSWMGWELLPLLLKYCAKMREKGLVVEMTRILQNDCHIVLLRLENCKNAGA